MAIKPSDKSLMEALAALRTPTTESEEEMGQLEELSAREEAARKKLEADEARNRWLSVAEKVGGALVNIGAAQQARKAGADLSRMDLRGPESNLPELQRGARQSYMDEVQRSELLRNRLEEARKQRAQEDVAAKRSALDTEKFKYGQEMDAYLQSLRDQANEARVGKREDVAAAREEARMKREEQAQLDRMNKEELKSIRDSIEQRRKELQAANTLATQYIQYEDLDKKSQKALDAKAAEVAAKAGISPEDLENIKETTKSKGWFWDSIDPKAAGREISKRISAPLQDEIAALERRQQELIGGKPAANMVQSKGSEVTPAANFPVKIFKEGMEAEVANADELQEALQDGWATSK
jgi:hypothetical protein